MSALGFRVELQKLINRESRENGTNTPDFILTEYLAQCLVAFDLAVQRRERYYGRPFHSFEKPAHPPADVANSCEVAAAADGIHQSRPDSAETLGVMDQPAGECAAHETSAVLPSRIHEKHADTCGMNSGSANCTCGGQHV